MHVLHRRCYKMPNKTVSFYLILGFKSKKDMKNHKRGTKKQWAVCSFQYYIHEIQFTWDDHDDYVF